jgi:adenine-specific DNA-methyltransferase
MQNLLEDLRKLLDKSGEFTDENGDLLKNKIIENALKIDPNLIKLLLKSKEIKKHFFTDIDGVLVFDKIKFQNFVSNKQFLPDSYTMFKNKIGLIDEKGEYIASSGDVTLVWPYKDCVLEGSQTKEDQKRDEIFWNEILAPDEIDRLFDPKVLTNWKRYDEKGEHILKGTEKIDFDKENLIIKGNNLLVMHSLIERFLGKVKLIYIDPPYNMGGDSFRYNDKFNEASWLTFMKNRLHIAHKLLDDRGAIFIQIDHHELGPLILLMNEIFGKNNKVQIISVKAATPAGFKTVNPGPIDVTEYILFYTKDKSKMNFKKSYVPVGYNKNYKFFLEKTDKSKDWVFVPIKDKVLEQLGIKDDKEGKKKYGTLWQSLISSAIAEYAFNNAENTVSIRDPHKPTEKLREKMRLSSEVDHVIEYQREDGSILYLYKGGALAFYSEKIREIDNTKVVTELLTDFWDHISWAGIAKEGGVILKNGKKPEKLMRQILDICTEKGDIVLDFFAGSGTLGAVAHKMGYQYILIEQLDYIHELPEQRLKNVINGDTSGISKAVGWKGGGAFIYCELMQWNELYMEKIQKAKNTTELKAIWKEISQKAFYNYFIDVKAVNDNISDFDQLPIKDQKKFLIETLDKNQLYVNHSEIDDVDYKVSVEDKKLNFLFYSRK